jgi:hypothetical protein
VDEGRDIHDEHPVWEARLTLRAICEEGVARAEASWERVWTVCSLRREHESSEK